MILGWIQRLVLSVGLHVGNCGGGWCHAGFCRTSLLWRVAAFWTRLLQCKWGGLICIQKTDSLVFTLKITLFTCLQNTALGRKDKMRIWFSALSLFLILPHTVGFYCYIQGDHRLLTLCRTCFWTLKTCPSSSLFPHSQALLPPLLRTKTWHPGELLDGRGSELSAARERER